MAPDGGHREQRFVVGVCGNMLGMNGDAGMGARDEVTITPYRDGPLLVRGPVRLVTPDGREIPRSPSTIALCRCGKSRVRPFCDGTHKLIGFHTPESPQPLPDDDLS